MFFTMTSLRFAVRWMDSNFEPCIQRRDCKLRWIHRKLRCMHLTMMNPSYYDGYIVFYSVRTMDTSLYERWIHRSIRSTTMDHRLCMYGSKFKNIALHRRAMRVQIHRFASLRSQKSRGRDKTPTLFFRHRISDSLSTNTVSPTHPYLRNYLNSDTHIYDSTVTTTPQSGGAGGGSPLTILPAGASQWAKTWIFMTKLNLEHKNSIINSFLMVG